MTTAPVIATGTKEAPPPPFLVLAHNPASAKTLGDYIIHLLYQTTISTKEGPNYQAWRIPICININITYILSLSPSSQKTFLQTLSLLFPLGIPKFGDIAVSTTISVTLLRFTPPEGMPYFRSVCPTEIEEVVKGLIPDADVWVIFDADDVDSDTKVEYGPEEKGRVRWRKCWGGLQKKTRKGRTELNKPNIW